MAEHVHLIGAEEVSRAGTQISSAASDMQRAASNIDQSVFNLREFMDDWLNRFEYILNEHQKNDITNKISNEIIKIGDKWIDISNIVFMSETGVVPDLPPENYGFFTVWMKFCDKPVEFFGNKEDVEKQHGQILDEWQKYKKGGIIP